MCVGCSSNVFGDDESDFEVQMTDSNESVKLQKKSCLFCKRCG